MFINDNEFIRQQVLKNFTKIDFFAKFLKKFNNERSI